VKVVRRLAVVVAVLGAAALLGVAAGLALGRIGAGDPADAAVRDRLDTRAAEIARSLQITDPPMVEPVRIVPLHEWAATEVDCIHRLGFDATATPDDFGIMFDAHDEADIAAFRRAFYTCEVQYPTTADAADPQRTT
jgi:hypothetical protein